MPTLRDDEGGAKCHFSFPESYVPADEPIHRRRCAKVRQDFFDGSFLIRRFVVGKSRPKTHVFILWGRVDAARTESPQGLRLQ